MTSHPDSYFEIEPKDEAVSDFVSDIGNKLQHAFLELKKEERITMQSIAKKIGVDRSRIHRCLSGYSNLTAESIAELAWALEMEPVFTLRRKAIRNNAGNHFESAETQIPVAGQATSTTIIDGKSGNVAYPTSAGASPRNVGRATTLTKTSRGATVITV